MPGQVPANPAIADLDGDGRLEIIATSQGQVLAFRADGSVYWTSTPTSPENSSPQTFTGWTNSPVIADLDGNGSLEVVLTAGKHVAILRGDNGQQLSASSNGDTRPTLWMWFLNNSTPAIGDIDNDGKLELASGGSHTNAAYGFSSPSNGPGFVYAWRDFDTWLGSPAAPNRPRFAAPWPMYHGGANATGVYPQLTRVGPLGALLRVGESQTFQVRFRDSDGAAVTWSLSETDPSQIVQVSRTSGTVETVNVTLTAPAAPGEYTATLRVDGGSAGSQTITVSVTAVAGNVSRVSLPVTVR
jgi:hypothetical protein